MRGLLWILPFVLVVSGGCMQSSRRPAVRATGVEPLREAEFDEFANRLAGQIAKVVQQHGYQPPATIAIPRVEVGGVEKDSVARSFALRLAEGLSDRLGGAAVFRQPGISPPRLGCTLRFDQSEEDPGRRSVFFRLFEELESTGL